MRWLRLVVAVILVLLGALWIGQGTGTVAGSAMSGQSMWAYVGVVLVIAGLAIGAWALIRRPASRA